MENEERKVAVPIEIAKEMAKDEKQIFDEAQKQIDSIFAPPAVPTRPTTGLKPVAKPVEQEEKDISLKPVVKGSVSVKQKGSGEKLLETFFKGSVETVKKGVWRDVVVPTIRDLIWSAFERAGRGLIYGDDDRYYRDSSPRGSTRAREVDFTAFSNKNRSAGSRSGYDDYDSSSVYDYGELRFEFDRDPNGRPEYVARRDAEEVLTNMLEICQEYGWVSVANMFELAKLPKRYTDRDYGWRELRNYSIERGRNCYILKLDRPRPR